MLVRATHNELAAIEERLWAEAVVRDATHGRDEWADEWACVLYALVFRYARRSPDDLQVMQMADSTQVDRGRAGRAGR